MFESGHLSGRFVKESRCKESIQYHFLALWIWIKSWEIWIESWIRTMDMNKNQSQIVRSESNWEAVRIKSGVRLSLDWNLIERLWESNRESDCFWAYWIWDPNWIMNQSQRHELKWKSVCEIRIKLREFKNRLVSLIARAESNLE